MNYINTNTLAYPVTQGEIREMFPNISFPEQFEPPAPFAQVYAAPEPAYNLATQRIVPAAVPSLVNGQWLLGWTVEDLAQVDIDQALDAEKTSMWEQIKAIRDANIQGGVNVAELIDNGDGTFTNFSKWFHTDTFSRTQYSGYLLLGVAAPSGIQWKTMDGTFVEMTQELMGKVVSGIASKDAAVFAKAEALRAEVNASTQPSSVVITGGWPPVFTV